jgi:hypothetical protein
MQVSITGSILLLNVALDDGTAAKHSSSAAQSTPGAARLRDRRWASLSLTWLVGCLVARQVFFDLV